MGVIFCLRKLLVEVSVLSSHMTVLSKERRSQVLHERVTKADLLLNDCKKHKVSLPENVAVACVLWIIKTYILLRVRACSKFLAA